MPPKPTTTFKVFAGTYTEAVTITKSTSTCSRSASRAPSAFRPRPGRTSPSTSTAGPRTWTSSASRSSAANAGIQFGTHFDSPASASGSGSAIGDTVFGYAQVGIEVIGTGSRAEVGRHRSWPRHGRRCQRPDRHSDQRRRPGRGSSTISFRGNLGNIVQRGRRHPGVPDFQRGGGTQRRVRQRRRHSAGVIPRRPT